MSNTLFPTGTVNSSVSTRGMGSRIHVIFVVVYIDIFTYSDRTLISAYDMQLPTKSYASS